MRALLLDVFFGASAIAAYCAVIGAFAKLGVLAAGLLRGLA